VDILKEIISLAGAVSSIIGFLLGFFVGAPYWKKKGFKMAQKQEQKKGKGIVQYQEQKFES
jgi:hypothetical protein